MVSIGDQGRQSFAQLGDGPTTALVRAYAERQREARYVPPVADQRDGVADTWRRMAAGDLDGARELGAAHGYDVLQQSGDSSSDVQFILREHAQPDGAPRGWGMYLLRGGPPVGLTIEAPHPFSDRGTGGMSAALYADTGADALLVAGAPRQQAGGRADVAHVTDSVFDSIHQTQVREGARIVQLHGYAAANHPGYSDIVVSEGHQRGPTARVVADALRGLGWDAGACEGSTMRMLAGRSNVQGASTRAGGARFLHIEVSDSVRRNFELCRDFSRALATVLRST